MSSLNFDQCQFERSRAFPVSAATGISYEDYRSMQTATRGAMPVAWVPPFALNDKKLQKVLLSRAWRYVHGSRPVPETINRDEINKAATARALRGHEINKFASAIQHEIVEKHRAAVRKAGGFLQLYASIAFRSWRLGMDSVSVGASVGMTPQAVRQALWRMRDVAKRLGFDVGRAGHTAGILRGCKPKLEGPKEETNIRVKREKRKLGRKPHTVDSARIIAAYQSGHSITRIAEELEYGGGCGLTPVRNVLIRAGVYQPRSTHHKVNLNDVNQAVALYQDGKEIKAIAALMGYKWPRSIRDLLRKAGVYKKAAPGRRGYRGTSAAISSNEPAPPLAG
ncbi:MAG TPA: hypothetical protein VGK24_00060 [Candidatus Angelobacter sp.]|jgi:hypothetical protein